MRPVILAAGAALLLAACGGTDPTPVVAAASPAASPRTAPFLAAYRAAYPKLAKDRSDKGIANDLRSTCFDITHESDTAVIVQRVAGRFAAHDGTPATKAQAAAILELARGYC